MRVKNLCELQEMTLLQLGVYWEELYQEGHPAKVLDSVQSVIDAKREGAVARMREIRERYADLASKPAK